MSSTSQGSQRSKGSKGRDALGAYLAPASFSSSQVLYHTADFVAIHDLYPKSSVHVLLLPRTSLSTMHPIDAFEREPALLAACKTEAAKATALVSSELQRRFSRYSVKDQALQEATTHKALQGVRGSQGANHGELPTGRDWQNEVLVGVHAGPSMVSALYFLPVSGAEIDNRIICTCMCSVEIVVHLACGTGSITIALRRLFSFGLRSFH